MNKKQKAENKQTWAVVKYLLSGSFGEWIQRPLVLTLILGLLVGYIILICGGK